MPHRQFSGGRLVIASHNPGKVREISDLLAPYGADVVSVAELGLPEPVEDGDTFIKNAEIKALAAARASGFPSLADDSGLCVHALNDDPGVYSARWAGKSKDFVLAMEKVAAALKKAESDGNMDKTAHFVCALTLAWPDGHTETFEGMVFGKMVWPMRGNKGFGYDPAFVPDGFDKTFGEMDPKQKHLISHRANAFALLIDACFRAN